MATGDKRRARKVVCSPQPQPYEPWRHPFLRAREAERMGQLQLWGKPCR